MALLNNTPANLYIYIENMVVVWGEKVYVVNSIYTKDKYIYFDINDPETLKTFNVRQSNENLILIIKNDLGIAIELEHTGLELTFDGINKKALMTKLNSVNKNSQEYKNELSEINDSVNSLSDDLVKTNTFNEIKETFNTSTIQLNNKLVSLTVLVKNSVSDNLLTTSEKGNINYEYGLFEQRILEVLSQSNSLIALYSTSSSNIDENVISSVENNESELTGLVAELNIQMNELVNLQTEAVTSADIVDITSNLTTISSSLVSLKDNCNNLIYLGAGNTIVDTTNNISFRLDTLDNIVSELKESVTSGFEEEKKNIQNIINNDINICNKLGNLLYQIVSSDGNQMTQSQKSSIGTYCNGLENNLNKLKGIYEVYYENEALDSTLKKQFKESMDDFIKIQTTMTDDLKESISDLILTSKEYRRYFAYLELFRSARSDLSSKFMSVINLVINSQGSDSIDAINTKIQNINDSIANITQEINTIKNKCDDFDKRLKALEG